LRRLAAILAADVVGYSRLMGVDEAGTLARLNRLRSERIEPLIASHHGRIFKVMGDGILVEFASVVDAVACAAAWQRGATGDDLCFRIGINIGDVIVEGEDIHGNGVNVAARLEGLADPGGICLSGSVHDEVRGKLDLAFEDMGPQQVKNIADPVRAWRVAGTTGPKPAPTRPPAAHTGKPSIAVLPLDNMSPGAAQDGFADGLTEDIITALSRTNHFNVTARNSSFAWKGKSPDIRDVARTLGVAYVLEGSVRQGGGRARITVQLIEAVSGTHVWADRYDRPLDDEFAVQDEIAQRVSSILMERVWQAAARNTVHKPRDEFGLYDHIYRGLEYLHRLDPVAMVEAREHYRAALALDPENDLVHIGLGFSYTISAFWSDPDDRFLARAHQHGLKLAELAPSSAQTWRLLSRTYCGMGRWDEGWSCVQRALTLDPNDGDIIANRGVFHIFNGEPEEGARWIDKVLALHADTPQTVDIMYYWKALAAFTAGDYTAALALLTRVSGHDFIRSELLAACHARLGQAGEAQAQAAAVLERFPGFRLAEVRFWRAFRNEADRKHLYGALRDAGLPD
jgi:adenylate cyclase